LGAGVTTSSLTQVGTLSSLTVSGNLTVDTDTLFVDAANNRVGILKIIPTCVLDVALTGTTNIATTTITKVTDFGTSASFGFNGLANNNDGVFFGMGAGGGNGIPAGIGFMREAAGWNTALAFYTNNVTSGPNSTNAMQEKMRLTSDGKLLVGTTSAGAMLAVKSNSATLSPIATTSITGDTIYQAILVTKFDNDTTTSQNFIQFQVNNGTANCGRITANGANTAAFGSTSDIRLKEHVENLSPQLENILNLRPVEFDYIESEGGGHQIGFIAQEMQAIYPDVVSERGEDDMLMITGWSKTEARLVKALQEAVAKIETLETRLSALEGK
jgi:hypothetical protein